MSRRLELRKEKVQARELMTVREDNIKEVVENIVEVIKANSEENIWEAVNTMLRADTDTSVLDCVYKMVSNRLGFTKYCISNPFEIEEDKLRVYNMKRIKALILSKMASDKLKGITENPPKQVTDNHEIEVVIAKRFDGNDIHISRINERYSAYCLTNFWSMRDKTEVEIIEWLDREIS